MAIRKTSRKTTDKDPAATRAAALLAWYDEAARTLPWRTGPAARRAGARPDPYAVWLSEVMLQQTTVAAVAPRFTTFLARWPTVGALAAAPIDDVLGEWAGLGYYARARNLHACARAVADKHGGIFPQTEEALRALPGVGPYTAAAVAAIAYDVPAVVVDGNVERVVARLFAVEAPLPAARAAIRTRTNEIAPAERPGDFAQAMMDLGALLCTPRNPQCDRCPIARFCAAHARGEADAFPKKAPKTARPTRRGAAFALFDGEGRVLLERRAEKGLLGGMLGLPGTAWTETAPEPFAAAPVSGPWRRAGAVRHTFTHFHLDLDVFIAETRGEGRAGAPEGLWAAPETARLPTVMKKALTRALAMRAAPGAG